MDPRDTLRSELKAIYTATVPFVKELRRLRSHVIASQFTNIGITARKLYDRNNLLLPAFRRQVERIREEFESQVEFTILKYPHLYKPNFLDSSMAEPVKEQTVSRKVSITLPATEWQIIEYSIGSGATRSFSDYFRQLHMSKIN